MLEYVIAESNYVKAKVKKNNKFRWVIGCIAEVITTPLQIAEAFIVLLITYDRKEKDFDCVRAVELLQELPSSKILTAIWNPDRKYFLGDEETD